MNPTPPAILKTLRALIPQRPLTYFEAERLAELQANRLRELMGITGPHLPEEAISSLPRVFIKRRYNLPVSGLTYWSSGKWVIGINANEPHGRQRFSLSHEFKHVLDHTTKQWLYPDGPHATSQEKAEHLADYFAGCLLMPKRHVKSLYGQRQRLSELARIFDVTPRAMSVRLGQLGLTDAVQRCQWPSVEQIPEDRIYHRKLSPAFANLSWSPIGATA